MDLESYYFTTKNIKNIEVKKDDGRGVIYITSKNPSSYNFLSYATLKRIYFAEVNKPIMLLVNGKFIKNFIKVNIDSLYIFKVEVESGEDFKELKNLYLDLSIVNIKLNSVNNCIGERLISLQGIPSNSMPQ